MRLSRTEKGEKQVESVSLGFIRALVVLISWEEQTLLAAGRRTPQPHVNHGSGQMIGSPKPSCLSSLGAVVSCYRFD